MTESYRVLVAEDEPTYARTVARYLEGRGHEVRVAGTGKATQKALSETEWDVLLLDLKLPDADGVDLLAQVRQEHADLQTIIVTGFANVESAIGSMRLGAFDYVTKPLDPWVLRAKVSVFVDLWEGNRRVRAQAARTARLQRQVASAAEQVGHCLDLVADVNANPGAQNELRSLLTQLADELRQ